VGASADRDIGRIRRGSVALFALVGIYGAVELAPLPDRIGEILAGIAWVLAALVCARLLIHLASLLLSTSVAHVAAGERARIQREYVPLGEKVVTLAVSLIFVIVVLKHFGQDVTSLVAALGVGSLAIGLAAQQTLGNMIAGFVLLVDRPFRPGERIKLASGEIGAVVDIGVRSTRIQLDGGNLLIVPNTELANSRVQNVQGAPMAEVKLMVALAADVERALALLEEVARGAARVLPDPAPLARVLAVTPVGIELSLLAPVSAPGDVIPVENQLRRAAVVRFREARLELAVGR
jgi:small-conductance mechanosensitive channel